MIALYHQVQFKAVLSKLDLLIEKSPHVSMLFNLQGSSRAALLINDGAFDSFKRVLSLTPDRAEIYYTRENIRKKMDAWEAAIDSCNQAPKIKPDYAEAYCNRASAFFKRGDFAAGWQDYDWRWKKAKLNSNPLNGQTCIAPEKSGAGFAVIRARGW